MNQQSKRLYRSQSDRIIGGVCGGVAEYLQVDSTVIRVLWILLTLLGGSGIILYIVSLFIMPVNPVQTPMSRSSNNALTIVGIVLIVVGAVIFMENMDLLHIRSLWRLTWEYLLPILLIAAGAYMLLRPRKQQHVSPSPSEEPPPATEPGVVKTLRRSLSDRKLLGVCGGLASYFETDPTIVRLLFVLFTLLSFGLGVVAYLLFFFLMPEELLGEKPK